MELVNKLMFIFGTRPEAIKLAPVIIELRRFPKDFEIKICLTGQHEQMLKQVIDIFKIEADYDLKTMRYNQDLFDVSSRILIKLKDVLVREKPDMIIVQGDTTTVFIASLAAYYLKIKIAHVEAGLRTFDKFNPFPEEINRKLTDVLADLHFAPTEKAKENLIKEGINEDRIHITGNTVIDALLMIIEMQKNQNEQERMRKKFQQKYGINIKEKKIILVTGHRRESFGEDFENICLGLKRIAEARNDIQIIYPVHLNPNVRKPVNNILSNKENVFLIDPLDYYTFVWLMKEAYFILTDSGGIQEEAPALGKPVLVMRRVTERPEAIEAGSAKLVGVESNIIFSEVMNLLEDREEYNRMATVKNPFGDGKASERIRGALFSYFNQFVIGNQ